MKKPNGYYYWIAKEFLKQAYSKSIVNSFYSFTLSFKHGYGIVECFNGGAFINIKIGEDKIYRSGHYDRHRFVNKSFILQQANQMITNNNIPKYYEIRFRENISTNSRCVVDIEKGKRDVIKFWNLAHLTSPISEPINWIITEV